MKSLGVCIKNSGAHQGVIISFKSKAVFSQDPAFKENPEINKYGPVRANGPILVWDVKIERYLK